MTAATTVPITLVCRDEPNFQIQSASSFDSLEYLRDDWDRLVKEAGASIHLSFDWCRRWWRHYGVGRELRVVVCRSGTRLVGVVPMFCERMVIGPVAVRIAKVVGSDSTLGMCDLPVQKEYAERVITAVITKLISAARCEIIAFGPMSADASIITAAKAACGTTDSSVRLLRNRRCDSHTVIRLPNSFDSYLKSLRRDERKSYRRRLRLLLKQSGARIEILRDPESINADFPRFVDMHQEQWVQRRNLGHFGDWPGARAFHLDLAVSMAELGRARLVRVAIGEKPIAYQYAFAMGDTAYAVLSARRTNSNWDRYALGHLAFLSLIEYEIVGGRRFVDIGRGHYEYKLRFGGVARPLHTLVLVRNDLAARLRAIGFCSLSWLLDTIYYKLWFCRLAPQLRLSRQPLWKSWIHSRP